MVKVTSALMCHVMLRVVSKTLCPALTQSAFYDVASHAEGGSMDSHMLQTIQVRPADREILISICTGTCRDRVHIVEVA